MNFNSNNQDSSKNLKVSNISIFNVDCDLIADTLENLANIKISILNKMNSDFTNLNNIYTLTNYAFLLNADTNIYRNKLNDEIAAAKKELYIQLGNEFNRKRNYDLGEISKVLGISKEAAAIILGLLYGL